MDVDVVIAGGGIGGAVLALSLARRDRSVCVLEREALPARVARPEVLHAPTLLALDRLGVGEGLRAEASIPLRGFELRRGKERLFGFTASDLAASAASPRSTDPDATRALILEAALATGGVQVQRGAEVREVLREGARWLLPGLLRRADRDVAGKRSLLQSASTAFLDDCSLPGVQSRGHLTSPKDGTP